MGATKRTGALASALLVALAVAGVVAPATAAGVADPAGGARGPAASLRIAPTPAVPAVRVIVTGDEAGARPQARAARSAVIAAGGRVERVLPLVGGVAAAVPQRNLVALRSAPGVRTVTPNSRMTVAASDPDQEEEGSEPEPRSVHRAEIRADAALSAGATGEGVTVALLDTGINPHRDLEGRVLPVRNGTTGDYEPCVNLSGEPGCADSYGHGTFLAGLIAGSGAGSGGRYAGVAPAADLVSIKVAGEDGSADLSNVLAGIQWAVSFRDRYRIRVLNLSLGTDSEEPWQSDPLNYAVQRAWRAGIVVTVSASNRGPDLRTISKPGDDPWVLTVAAVDDRQTPAISDDRLPQFSGRGPTAAGLTKPDLVAPGAMLVSTRAYSAIDEEFPPAMSGPYRQGSGTSMSTAVVSGAVAQLLSRKPSLPPDRVKFLLMRTARPVAESSPYLVGRGIVDVYAALTYTEAGLANQGLSTSSGLGSITGSRGTARVQTTTGDVVLDATLTSQLLVWEQAELLGDWGENTWYASSWARAPIYRTVWSGSDWAGHNWHGSSFYGEVEDSTFYGHNWHGGQWYGVWK